MSDFDTFDLYQVLGVDRDASEAEIREAFTRAAMTEHPDRSGHPDAEDRIRRVYEARDTLLNAGLRQRYDPDADRKARREAQEQARRSPPPPPQRPDPPPSPSPRSSRSWTPRRPPRWEPRDHEDDREAARQELEELAGSTILSQRRWFRAEPERQDWHPAPYAEFLRREQRYLWALRFGSGLLFALLAVGSFATGDILGGVISVVVAAVALLACAYLASRDWFIWLYLFAAVPTVWLAKLILASLSRTFYFAKGRFVVWRAARSSSSGSDD